MHHVKVTFYLANETIMAEGPKEKKCNRAINSPDLAIKVF